MFNFSFYKYFFSPQGHADIVRFLIKKGAEVNVAERKIGQTALHLAAKSGKIWMFE